MASKGSNVIIITKKARAPEGHSGGAWKVAYADFVTAMMALFIVLWILSQTDQGTRERISEYFRTGMFSGSPALLVGGTGIDRGGALDTTGAIIQLDQQSLMQSAEAVRKAVAAAAKGNGELSAVLKNIDISVTDDGLLIQILDNGDDLLFDLSSAELKPRLKTLLEAIAPVLGKLKNKIQVHGHTDARPFPAAAGRTNWELSFERANNARRCLETHGLSNGQLSGVFAHGSSLLYVKSNPNDSRNRRLAILAVRQGREETAAAGGVLPRDIAGASASASVTSAPSPSASAVAAPSPSANTTLPPLPFFGASAAPRSTANTSPH
jgi:chemotaxis protein MotB